MWTPEVRAGGALGSSEASGLHLSFERQNKVRTDSTGGGGMNTRSAGVHKTTSIAVEPHSTHSTPNFSPPNENIYIFVIHM